MTDLKLDIPVRYIKGVGPKLADILSRVGVYTVKDLLQYFPREYEDRKNVRSISNIKIGEEVLVQGSIKSIVKYRTKRNFMIIKAVVNDPSGSITVLWFNQPFLINVFKKGTKLFLKGRLEHNAYSGEALFVPRYYEIKDDGSELSIVPIYPLTEGLFQKKLRSIIKTAIDGAVDRVKDPLSRSLKSKYSLPDLQKSMVNLHYPKEIKEAMKARNRIIFDELLVFQLGILLRKKIFKEKLSGIAFKTEADLINKFKMSLPFSFTNAQQRVISEILSDMNQNIVMNRLLQGDVGSGKTIVAIYAMLVAIQNGYQVAIMVPTEILANQHYQKIKEFIKDLDVDVLMLTGSENAKTKQKINKKISSDDPLIIVGTHALIEEKVSFGKLGLVIVDEQHRFGVVQRSKLRSKGNNPDLLIMTATPIPRSLALTIYGDLDRSVIDEMPPGRTPVITRFVSDKETKRMYEFIKKEISNGRQAYIVYPLVEESEKIDLKAVKTEYSRIKQIFPENKVELIHGRMKGEEKDKIMTRFKEERIDILISTTVIEVGIDIPNSTIMVIEHAERFGLSQLHQLRGRIGRGSERSYCFLIADPKNEFAKKRIKAMLDTNDGFKIAEEDLKIRGPGEILGTQQSGISFIVRLPNFRAADIIHEYELIKTTRSAAEEIIRLDQRLVSEENKLLKQEILRKYGKFLELGALN